MLLRLAWRGVGSRRGGGPFVHADGVQVPTVHRRRDAVALQCDEEPHTVASANGQFAPSQALDSNDRYETTFSKPGTYVYYCTVHPFMTGTVTVK